MNEVFVLVLKMKFRMNYTEETETVITNVGVFSDEDYAEEIKSRILNAEIYDLPAVLATYKLKVPYELQNKLYREDLIGFDITVDEQHIIAAN